MSTPPAGLPEKPKRRWRGETTMWIAVAALAVFMQWPMLKGGFYRLTGTAPPRASIAWRTDLKAALAEARGTGRLVLVDFSADWCPPCITMKHDVWPDPEVARLIAPSYVPLLVDVDTDTVASAKYDVPTIPTLLILDHDGTVLAQAGYLPASGMRRFLEEHAR